MSTEIVYNSVATEVVVILKYEDVIRIRKELTLFYEKVCSKLSTDTVIYSLMSLRNYTTVEMYNTLKEVGVTHISYISDMLLFADATETQLKEWGLLDSHGNYLLSGRYVVPIRDIEGYICALVGWDPAGGNRKYVTTPTLGFSRDTTFFNIECATEKKYNSDGTVYLVEGIFDTLSLRSLGLFSLGNMGLELSSIKSEILTRWGKVVAIPDNDKSGKKVNPIINSEEDKSKEWKIHNDNVFIILPKGVKDTDDFIRDYDCLEDLLGCKSASIIKRLKEDS